MVKKLSMFAGVAAVLLAVAGARASVWVEGESPVSVTPAEIKYEKARGPAEVLSGGAWMSINLDASTVAKSFPADGVVIRYALPVGKADAQVSREVWLRVGYEQVRPTFSWRIDGGDWQTVTPDAPTTNVVELGVWAPVAWLHAGNVTLAEGNHTLEVKIPNVKNAKGESSDIRFALDAICLADGTFRPDGTIKPGDTSWITEADKKAAGKVFDLPAEAPAAQTAVSLEGTWRYAGDDEMEVVDRLGPTATLPDLTQLNWRAIAVPSNRNAVLPQETYVHRFCMRAALNVPTSLAGRSMVLHVPDINMMATVFVNGVQCGWMKTPQAAWDVDITKAVVAGKVNDLVVVIKDPFYGVNFANSPKHLPYIPYSFWHYNTGQSMDMTVLGQYHTGIEETAPSVVIGGPVYTADVFAKPLVKDKKLELEITLHNPGIAPADVSVGNAVQPVEGGAVEKTFAGKTVTVPAGQDAVVTVSEPWANPKLWWPDSPQQYNVVTQISIGGKVLDERTTRFGFRQWTWDGPDLMLNGIPFHGIADCDTTDIAKLKAHGQTMARVWWANAANEKYLDECDAKGMPVRRTGIFDGEGSEGFYDVTKEALWDNYRLQEAAFIKSERNHPSIFMWSLENEITFINGHVTGQDHVTTPQVKKSYEVFRQVDPTRPMMTDGGNALLDESMPIYGGHYMEPPFNTFPEGCYDFAGLAHRQVWPITQKKPLVFGEAMFTNGFTPTELATVGGEAASIGPGEARPAVSEILNMVSQGYRWNGISFQLWSGGNIPTYYNGWSPTAVLCRQWDWTFGSGQKVTRTLGIFNDTRSEDPITLTATLVIGGKEAGKLSSVHQIAPGRDEKVDVTLALPEVKSRQEAIWKLVLSRGGKTVFEDDKAVSILPPAVSKGETGAVAVFEGPGNLAPGGMLSATLAGLGLKVTVVKSLNNLPADAKVLVVGPNALDLATSTSSVLASWASSGRAVIVLEQEHPLKFQGLPGEMDTDTNHGCLGFVEDLSQPIFEGLQAKDFYCWGRDGYLYRNAYQKPNSGGKSLIQCDNSLKDSALVQMQAGKGILLLSQLLIGEKLQYSATAQRLLLNMIAYGASYKLTFAEAHVAAGDNADLKRALDQTGLQYQAESDPLAAIAKPGGIAVVDASPANLAALASHLDSVRTFTQGGGWLVFNRLAPEGIADYNKIVGYNHIIRKFQKEKVTWSVPRNPLTGGIPVSNIVLGTGQKIMVFASPEWPDENGYSYVVDLDDVAPFGTSTYWAYGNAVNGFTQKDGAWQLIQNLPPEAAVMPIKLPKPEQLLSLTWVSDTNYEGTTKIGVEINGKKYAFDTVPNGDPQTFELPDHPASDALTVRVLDWAHDPSHLTGDKKEIVGIDNIYLKVARPADFRDRVKPMLNIGAMVEYPQGKGGIVLCNVKFRDHEENPDNAQKKRAIIAGLLRNMNAKFGGGSTVIAGGDVSYTPISIAAKANQFRGEQGWFGDKAHSFETLPSGKQTLAGVLYDVYHFKTSIVPEAIMLGGQGAPGNLPESVTGIPVHQKADALFFLQAAHLNSLMNDQERRDGKRFEMADYVIHYADGSTEKAPVYAEVSVADYLQDSPVPLAGAQIAWQHQYDNDKKFGVAYSMQWNNPHPEKEIAEIDLVYGPDRRGTPALLAITAGVSH